MLPTQPAQPDLTDLNSRIDALAQQSTPVSSPEAHLEKKSQIDRMGDDLERFANAVKSIAAAGYSFGRDIPDVTDIDIARGWWEADFDRNDLYGVLVVKAIWHGHLGYRVHAESGTRRDEESMVGTHELPRWVETPDMHFDAHVGGEELEATAAKAVAALAHIVERTRPNIRTPNQAS